MVMENSVNYQMVDAQVKVSELLLKLHKAEFLPDLAAFYQHEKAFNTKAFTFNPPDLIGVSLNIPIFGSGAKLSRVGQAKRELIKAQNNKSQAVDGLWVDFYTSKSALLNAWDSYNTASNNLQLAKKIYNRSLIKYTNGMLSNIELTQVQNQFLNAQSNYYTAIQSLITSKNKLEKMLSKN
jgi:outer membrane protein TolC